MKEEFKEVINSSVKPLLKKEGYKKKALTFYKTDGELVYIINFQKSRENNHSELGFYINCGIYCKEIDLTLGNELIEQPTEGHCHFRTRVESISKKADAKFLITPKTDLERLKIKLPQVLSDVLNFYAKEAAILEDIILQMSKGGIAYETFKIFRYCIKKQLPESAKNIITHRKKHITDSRWDEKYRPRFLKILEEEKSDFTFKELDFEQRTELRSDKARLLKSNEESGQWGLEEGEYEHAITKFEQCLFIIPEPKTVFEESTRIYIQLGLSYLRNREHIKAKKAFETAKKCPNPDLEEIERLLKECG